MGTSEVTKSADIIMTPEYQQMMGNYVSILEKTNQQLGVWSNPYGIAIGVLSLFIAIIAIGVAVALWKHSKEQKDRFEQFLKSQEKIIRSNVELHNEKVKQAESKLSKLITKYNKQLESATKDNKKEIERAIADLEKEKASIGAYISPGISLGTVSGPSITNVGSVQGSSFLLNTDSAICTSCGKRFSFSKKFDLLSNVMTAGNDTVYCTFCGHPNIV